MFGWSCSWPTKTDFPVGSTSEIQKWSEPFDNPISPCLCLLEEDAVLRAGAAASRGCLDG